MSTVDNDLIEHVTKTIVEKFQPRRIVLFGSHARGDAGPDSDLDIMVEMDSELSPFRRAVEISKAFPFRDWPLDVFAFTPQEIAAQRNVVGDLIFTIVREGKTLYERP